MASGMVSAIGKDDYVYNVHVAARSASDLIDYVGIEAACKAIVDTAQIQCDGISKKIASVQCGPNVLSAEDKSMQPLIEEMANFIKTSIPAEIEAALESVKDEALQKYNNEQNRLNSEVAQEFYSLLYAARAAKSNKEG